MINFVGRSVRSIVHPSVGTSSGYLVVCTASFPISLHNNQYIFSFKGVLYFAFLPQILNMLMFAGKNCLDCGSDLKFSDNEPAVVTVYSQTGSNDMAHKVKVCRNQKCRVHYHHSHFTRKENFFSGNSLAKFFYPATTSQEIFVSSCQTAFTTAFLLTMLTGGYSHVGT